jgi:hypothetical protein
MRWGISGDGGCRGALGRTGGRARECVMNTAYVLFGFCGGCIYNFKLSHLGIRVG